jgi:hypothetical protein
MKRLWNYLYFCTIAQNLFCFLFFLFENKNKCISLTSNYKQIYVCIIFKLKRYIGKIGKNYSYFHTYIFLFLNFRITTMTIITMIFVHSTNSHLYKSLPSFSLWGALGKFALESASTLNKLNSLIPLAEEHHKPQQTHSDPKGLDLAESRKMIGVQSDDVTTRCGLSRTGFYRVKENSNKKIPMKHHTCLLLCMYFGSKSTVETEMNVLFCKHSSNLESLHTWPLTKQVGFVSWLKKQNIVYEIFKLTSTSLYSVCLIHW